MPEEWTREELTQRWRGFLSLYADPQLGDVLTRYPEARSVYFSFGEVERHDEALAAQILARPQTALYAAELALSAIIAGDHRRPRGECQIHFRVRGLTPARVTVRLEVRELRAKHGGRLLAIEGLVRRRSEVRPLVIEAFYQCEKCHAVVVEPQADFDLAEPVLCFEDQGGCGRASSSTRFKFLADRSTKVDAQRIVVQELPERTKEGEQPEKLTCWLFDDLAGTVKPGQRVLVNGIYRETAPERRRAGRGILNVHLEVLSVESDEKTGNLDLTTEDLRAIEEEARSGDVVQRIARSVAPTLYGLEIEKLAVTLQMFGGTRKPMPDGIALRGDIHILLLGDPSTGKSQLLSAVKSLHYRAVGATGKGASGAGITAAVVKDEVTGEYGLEPGALPMANGGILCVDEFEKMNEEDRGRMHPAMEQGIVEISKAGIQATMLAQAAVLAAANPKHGSWQSDRALVDQVELPSTLISRFDAVFVFKDVPDGAERDSRLARHILQAHYAGSLAEQDGAAAAAASLVFAPPLPAEFIRKYVYYARTRQRAPVMTPDTIARLERHFLDLRKESAASEEGGARITPRQLEGLVRFAEASARARLSRSVEAEDVDLAVRIFDAWVTRLGETGKSWDLNIMYGGLPPSVKDQMEKLQKIVREEDRGRGAPKTAVEERARRDFPDITPDRFRYLMDKLYTEGSIFERDDDHWRAA